MAMILINIFVVAITVIIHYEFLFRLSAWMPKMNVRHRFRIVLGVFGALAGHVIEVIVFAYAYFFMHSSESLGYLEGKFVITLPDCIYFSFTTYTTLGYGDIEPFGGIRYLAGVESLTGLVLITWTASFLYIEMRRYWDKK